MLQLHSAGHIVIRDLVSIRGWDCDHVIPIGTISVCQWVDSMETVLQLGLPWHTSANTNQQAR